jgi:hypothetical protein
MLGVKSCNSCWNLFKRLQIITFPCEYICIYIYLLINFITGIEEYFQANADVHSANKQKTNSVALSPQANYTDWSTATCQRNLVPTSVDRGVSRGQRGRFPTAINLSFLDQSRYFSSK